MKSGEKNILEKLREENERLKKELEISKLEKENRELREQIQRNRQGDYGVPYTWAFQNGTITLCNDHNFFEED